ncbi:hypothetical protein [Brevibacillus sp. DP1.3A]|uniref:hypothetical protein n=1 Tax=Brevibacillus sp. DP1.3A TaxID=2738867 RepID=UPI00156AAEE3|nr:hypothetical protein [Brevibacillus sp. DP1.3A]UED77518.1 hypothetical protein HP399_013990 [Brevibacillus sp. DP1.3A]
MKSLLKMMIGLAFAFWFFILWACKSLLSSDIPVTISTWDTILFSFSYLVSTVVALLYVRFTYNGKIHIFLSIPTLLWGLSIAQVFTHQYHPYDTLMSVIGFIGSGAIMFFSILMQRKSPNFT